MSRNYHIDRNIKVAAKIKEQLSMLPDFCFDYFISIEQRTSPLTRLGYAYDLEVFFDYVVQAVPGVKAMRPGDVTIEDMSLITSSHIERYLSHLSAYYYRGRYYSNNEAAKKRKLSSINSLFKYLFNNDLISANVAAKVSMPKLHSKEIIRLDSDEVSDMLETVTAYKPFDTAMQNSYNDNEFFRMRDLAILTLFLGTGIRVSELVGLNVDDIAFKTKSFIVTRKGGNRSVLYFSDEVKESLELWLPVRESRLKKCGRSSEAALFISSQNKRICVRTVENLVKKFAAIVSPQKKISPHKLRSTYGTALYSATKDIYVVAEVLGHKDVNTTKKHYANISEEIKKSASTAVVLNKKSDD